jgi:hypothetical protein
LEHLTLIIRAIGVFDLLSQRLCLIRGVGDTNQVAPRDTVERVARSADLLVDEVTSPDAVNTAFSEGPDQIGIKRAVLPGMVKRVQPALV